MTYVSIQNGLRGCYMPDSGYITPISSEREFRRLISHEREFGDYKRSGDLGYVWKRLKAGEVYSMVVGLSRDTDAYGLMVSAVDRADYLEYCESEGIEPED